MIEERLQTGEVDPIEEKDLIQKIANKEVMMGGVGTDVGNFISMSQNIAGIDVNSHSILKGFSFGTTDYSGAFKSGDITWNTDTGAVTGGSGVVMYRNGIVGASAGVTTFSINATTGAVAISGTITAAAGTIGGWTISSLAIYKDGATNAISSGMAPADYPFYAGKKYAGRATAPFRVTVAGAVTMSNLTVTGATGIASFTDAGDLVTVNEANVNALNLTNAPAEANADVTSTNETFSTDSDINALNTTNGPTDAGATLQTSVAKTAGENIAIRDCVCMGHAGVDTTVTVLEDTWANEASAATNYSTDTTFKTGIDTSSKNRYGYIKIVIPASITNSDISSVVLRLSVSSGGKIDNSLTLNVYRLTSALVEENVTWNVKPTNDAGSSGSSGAITSVPALASWVEIDITQLFKDWNDNTYANEGMLIKASSAGGGDNYLSFSTKEAGSSVQPKLEITGWADKTKAYKADSDDWEGVIGTIGFAVAAITSAASGKIQTSGIMGGFSGLTPGKSYYIDTTAGGITTTPGVGGGRKKVGIAVSTTELDIDTDPPLEYVGIVPAGITTGASWTERDISTPVPKRAKLADIEIRIRTASKTMGVRKTDSGLERKLASGAGGGEMRFFNMLTEVTEDDDGNRTVENISDGLSSMSIVGYWI